MTELTKQKCVPCSGETPPLSQELIAQYLKEIEHWELKGEKIERTFVFKNFDEAIDFINKVASIARAEEHHPDINIHDYKKVTVTLTTHVMHNLSSNDFIMAAKINDLGF